VTSASPRVETSSTTAPVRTPGRRLFGILTGLTALLVLLQGLWAGIFLEHDGQRDAAESWIEVHARGGEIALFLAVAALVVAWVKLRGRRDLLLGSTALVLLLVLESYIGGLIADDSQDSLTAVHVPLAMATMAVAVWLPLRARHASPVVAGHDSEATARRED
jgi:heme A synthase